MTSHVQFDLAESRPGPVLKTIWDNLTAREAAGDPLAGHIRRCGLWCVWLCQVWLCCVWLCCVRLCCV